MIDNEETIGLIEPPFNDEVSAFLMKLEKYE
jgi:hypothetical protein